MQFSLPLYDALLGVNIAADKAKAVVEAFEKESTDMTSTLATKADLNTLRDEVRQDMALLEARMINKLGMMILGAVSVTGGLVTTLIKVL